MKITLEELISVILWNCSHSNNKCLTPDYVNKKAGAFCTKWLSDSEIAS